MRAAIVSALLLAAACDGGGEVTALAGIYQLSSWTHNPDGCDREGPAAPEQDTFSHFYVKHEDALGDRTLGITLCEEIARCRSLAELSEGMDVFMSVSKGGDDTGWTGRTSALSVGDTCEGPVHDRLVTGVPDESVQIEEETRTVTEVPLEADTCDSAAAYEQADSLPCEQLTVLTGVFVEEV